MLYNTRHLLCWVSILCGGLFSCTASNSWLQEDTSVVFIFVDTLRADHVSLYGAKNPTTPNLERYAKQGAYFSRAYSHSGWTLPSAVSMFTGVYPHEHKVGRSPTSAQEFGSLPLDAVTLAELFASKGYKTGAVINNTFLAPDFGLAQGFQTYLYTGADNQDIRSAKENTDVALDWWDKQTGAKFLLLHYMNPHMNLSPPASTLGQFSDKQILDKHGMQIPFDLQQAFAITQLSPEERARPENMEKIQQILGLYDEEILAVDMEIQRAVEHIGTSNVLYVFTSDHGEEFWEFNDFEHGHHLKSVLTHVPLVFWGEGVPNIGEVSGLVSHVDMFHTILEQVDIPTPENTHGINILQTPISTDSMVISENTLYGDPFVSVVSSQYRLEINQQSHMAALWKLDATGREHQLLQDNLMDLSEPLFEYIRQVRGSIDPIEQVPGLKIPSQEAFQQLKKLGYIER